MKATRRCARCGARSHGEGTFCAECGDRLDDRQDGPPRTVARFELGAVIGHGGMGVVHQARDLSLGRQVALKLIAPSVSGDPTLRARFEAEARAAAAIDHPNVLPIFEAGEHDGELYLAMRLVDGTDLGAVISRRRRLGAELTAEIVAQIAAGLDAAHAQSLVHRDVKPANALVAGRGGREHVYLTDFGLAQTVDAGRGMGGMTEPGRVVGTANYMAPEQIEGGAIDGRVDVYALACVAFECLVGHPPYRRETSAATLVAQIHDEIPVASRSVPGLPHEVDEALAGGLAKDAERRFASCGALARALGEAIGVDAGRVPANPRVAAEARPRELPLPRPRPQRPVVPIGRSPAGIARRPPTEPTAVRPRPQSPGARERRPRVGMNLTLALLIALAVAAGAITYFVLPSGNGERDASAASGIVDAAQAVNENLAVLVSRLSRAPSDAAEREGQRAQLPNVEAELAGIAAGASSLDADGSDSIRRAVASQQQILDAYSRTLSTTSDAPPETIADDLERIDGRLHAIERRIGP